MLGDALYLTHFASLFIKFNKIWALVLADYSCHHNHSGKFVCDVHDKNFSPQGLKSWCSKSYQNMTSLQLCKIKISLFTYRLETLYVVAIIHFILSNSKQRSWPLSWCTGWSPTLMNSIKIRHVCSFGADIWTGLYPLWEDQTIEGINIT